MYNENDPTNVKVLKQDFPPESGGPRPKPEEHQHSRSGDPALSHSQSSEEEWPQSPPKVRISMTPQETLNALKEKVAAHSAFGFDEIKAAVEWLRVYNPASAKKYDALVRLVGEFSDVMDAQP